jgi:hypothetical protein
LCDSELGRRAIEKQIGALVPEKLRSERVRRLLFAKPLKFGAPFGFLFRIGHGSASLKIATAFATQLGSTGQYGTTRKPYPDIELCPKNRTN